MYALALKGTFNETEVTDLEKEYTILSNPVITKDRKGNIIAVTRDMESITIFSDIWSNLSWVRFEIFNNKYATTDQIMSVLQQSLRKNSAICTMKLIDDHGHEYYISE